MAPEGTNADAAQRLVARVVATHPAGRNLMLIGGFRYRFLDGSVRVSDDIDYHWAGDLERKQAELATLFRRTLLPEARRVFGYEGSVACRQGPDADSPAVRIVDLAFWQTGVDHSRIEIPVEVTRILCADTTSVRTVEGTVYATTSDADMIESKIIALFHCRQMRHRDLVDLFLFQGHLHPESRHRLASKMDALSISPDLVSRRIEDLRLHQTYHVRAIRAIVDSQLDPVAANQLNDAGGAPLIHSAILQIIEKFFGGSDEGA